MIRSLRRRFLLIAMFSLALTLFVIGGSINLGNYIRLTDRRMPSSRLFMKMTGISPLSGIIQTFRDVSSSPAKRSLRRATALFIWMKMRNHPTSTPSTSPPSVRATISALTDAILSAGKGNGYWGYYRYHLYPSDGSSESDGGTLGDCRLLFAVTIILYSSAPDLLYYFRLSGSCTFTSPVPLRLRHKAFADNIKNSAGLSPMSRMS